MHAGETMHCTPCYKGPLRPGTVAHWIYFYINHLNVGNISRNPSRNPSYAKKMTLSALSGLPGPLPCFDPQTVTYAIQISQIAENI